jgi:hypothetical protein
MRPGTLRRVDEPAEPVDEDAPVVLGRGVDGLVGDRGRTEADLRRRQEELGDAVGVEEAGRHDRATEEHVVVEVDEVLGQAGNVVQLRLDRVRVERRQRAAVTEEIAVRDDRQARVVQPQPWRHLVGGDEVDVADPRREVGQRPQ